VTFGTLPPDLRTPVPGPRSRDLGSRLRAVESRHITRVDEHGPIFWSEAAGANVRDVDGNIFLDLTAGFGVAGAGHANRRVTAAAAAQLEVLPHALGDVHPAARKVELLERLVAVAPGDLSRGILSADGSDAVESALKTALMATGRPGVIAFRGGYHGLGYGALAVTSPVRFRTPFEPQLYRGVAFAPFPTPDPGGAGTAAAIDAVQELVERARDGVYPVGAVIAEPVQGRGGIRVPPADFLPRLRQLCDDLGLVLILDEVYTGFGRTGRWFACQHQEVVPDILVVGKALAGGLPLSAALGRPWVMDAWPASDGEAIHTSTFLGNPVACAAAMAHLDEIERLGLVERAERLGRAVTSRFDAWVRAGLAAGHRGLGLMQAVVPSGTDPAGSAAAISRGALQAGVIVLAEADAVALTPPLVMTEAQLAHALGVIEGLLPAG
jgi:4-aminobutyrate aminotransferase-like enzyme